MADQTPAMAATKRDFANSVDGPTAYVLDPRSITPDAVAPYFTRVDVEEHGGPYGGIAFVSDDTIFWTNWELPECVVWRSILRLLDTRDLLTFVQVFGMTGMELEVSRTEAFIGLQHLDHENPNGLEGSRKSLPGAQLADPTRFVHGVERALDFIAAIDAQTGYGWASL